MIAGVFVAGDQRIGPGPTAHHQFSGNGVEVAAGSGCPAVHVDCVGIPVPGADGGGHPGSGGKHIHRILPHAQIDIQRFQTGISDSTSRCRGTRHIQTVDSGGSEGQGFRSIIVFVVHIQGVVAGLTLDHQFAGDGIHVAVGGRRRTAYVHGIGRGSRTRVDRGRCV